MKMVKCMFLLIVALLGNIVAIRGMISQSARARGIAVKQLPSTIKVQPRFKSEKPEIRLVEQKEVPLLTWEELQELGVDEQEDYINSLHKEMRKSDINRDRWENENVISGGKVINIPVKVRYMDTPEQKEKKILIKDFERVKDREKRDQERRNDELGLRVKRMSQEELMSRAEPKPEEESWLRRLIRSIFGNGSSK